MAKAATQIYPSGNHRRHDCDRRLQPLRGITKHLVKCVDERRAIGAMQESMIKAQAACHHRPGAQGPVDDPWPIFDPRHPERRDVGQIDDWRRAGHGCVLESTCARNRKRAALEIGDSKTS